jgi:hypothetical protein
LTWNGANEGVEPTVEMYARIFFCGRLLSSADCPEADLRPFKVGSGTAVYIFKGVEDRSFTLEHLSIKRTKRQTLRRS